ncbi:MAG: hypothetical protein WCL00_05975, partial [Bacteroidota bacterium]
MRCYVLFAFLFFHLASFSQKELKQHKPSGFFAPFSKSDSISASKIPVLTLPGDYLQRSLPASVDNSKQPFFCGPLDQFIAMTCQQYSGVAYSFGYEINRLRNKNGTLPENRYPPDFTYNFMNYGSQDSAVGFFASWNVIKKQGHATMDDWLSDSLDHYVGWMTGYDKYYHGMKNRLKAVYSIPVNTAEGILTLKHYLHDHLDGSSTGGVACFGASSNFTPRNFITLPPGTSDSGKHVITAFYPWATHGMTIVGYNDSIRYDLNGDGRCTNNIDINGDGIVDVKDWEIGGFLMVNSFGTWWGDAGYSYILYRAMALYYGNNPNYWDAINGIWNHSVFVIDADTGYTPLVTYKITLTHNSRQKIRIRAGISSDTTHGYPDHVMDFPLFNFQGGDLPMQGLTNNPNYNTLELGLDVTPLLSYVNTGETSRFFLIAEEMDSTHDAEGVIDHFSVIDYTNGVQEYPCQKEMVALNDDDITILSLKSTINNNKVHIITDTLSPYSPPSISSTQLTASGGTPPYQWKIQEHYSKKRINAAFPLVDQQPLYIDSDGIPYAKVTLPFHFPFYNETFDTVYVNAFGFISFESTHLPYYYECDEVEMLERSKTISPLFSLKNVAKWGNLGMWAETTSDAATFRWKIHAEGHDNGQYLNAALKIHSDGSFEFIYGDLFPDNPAFSLYTGVSKGDEENNDLSHIWNSADLAHQAFSFTPPVIPKGISLTKRGLITMTDADTTAIYPLVLKVTDRNKISDEKELLFSTGLLLSESVISGDDNLFKFGRTAHLKLHLANTGLENFHDIQVKLVTNDQSVIITDSLITIPSIHSGSSTTVSQAFSFHMGNLLPDQTNIAFSILLSDSLHRWKKFVSIPVSAALITIGAPIILDG